MANALQQVPYQWGNFHTETRNPYEYETLLRQAGLWDGFTNVNREQALEANRGQTVEGSTNWGMLDGYQLGSHQDDKYNYQAVRDANGNIVATDQNNEVGNGLTARDLSMMALVFGGGLGFNSLMAGAGGAGAGLSGMDLAADAALGSGNNILTAGSQFGGGLGGSMLSAADAGIGQFPPGMEGYGFSPVDAAAGGGSQGWAAGLDPLATAGSGGGGLGGLAEVGGMAGAAGGIGGAGGGAGAGSAVGTGAWNGVDFTGSGGGFINSLGSSLGSANSLANIAQAGIGLYGQHQALGAMKDATNQSNEFNRYAFDTIRGDNQPLVDLRNSVLPQIQGLLKNPGSITSDPGYQFQFAEGTKALNNGAAARGMTYSGAQGKALQRYGNDYGATKLDQSLNRLTAAAGLGQVGANSNNSATQNYANNGSNNALNMGNARGSAYAGGAGLVGNALQNYTNSQTQADVMRRLFGGP